MTRVQNTSSDPGSSVKLLLSWSLGRGDFNFSLWILLASSQIAPVTERNTLDFNGFGVLQGDFFNWYPPKKYKKVNLG